MEFGWKVVVGSIVGFFGAALGSVGGVGGGGIFVPMLTLIIGFDPKSSTAISKCQYLCIFRFLLLLSFIKTIQTTMLNPQICNFLESCYECPTCSDLPKQSFNLAWLVNELNISRNKRVQQLDAQTCICMRSSIRMPKQAVILIHII